jgi:ElaB/YqjD/DUF883 family membrane-anchored ribosome-binding protein
MAQSYQQDIASGTDKVAQLKKTVETTATDIANRGAQVATDLERRAEDAYDTTKKFVQEQPLLTIAGIAAFAFAIGALWKLAPARRSYGYDFLDRFADYAEPHYRALRRRW